MKLLTTSLMAVFCVTIGLLNAGCVTRDRNETSSRVWDDPDGTHHTLHTENGHTITSDPVTMVHHLFGGLFSGYEGYQSGVQQYPQYLGRQYEQSPAPVQIIIQTPPGSTVTTPQTTPPQTQPQSSDDVIPGVPFDGTYNGTDCGGNTTVAPQPVQPAPIAYQNYYRTGYYYPAYAPSLSVGVQYFGGRPYCYDYHYRQWRPYYRPGPIAHYPPTSRPQQTWSQARSGGSYGRSYGSAQSYAYAGGGGAYASASAGGGGAHFSRHR